jgi:DNA-binding response OmpR family regulator
VSITATDMAMPALGGRRVLVVESREDDAAALAAMLRLNGFDARTARTGADALAAAAASQPHVIVLDLDLPDADGCELIRRLRARPDPPAVAVVTGHTRPAVRRAAAAAGAAAYLLKPAEPTELAALIDRLCRTGD